MSDEAPVPLAEQIAVIKGPIAFAEHSVCYWADYPKSSAYIAATGNLRALRAVLATLQQHERALAEARQKAYLDAMGCCTPEPGEAWSREAIDAGDLIWGRICDLGNRASRPLTVTKPLVTAYQAGKAEAAEQHERAMAERDVVFDQRAQMEAGSFHMLERIAKAETLLRKVRDRASPTGTGLSYRIKWDLWNEIAEALAALDDAASAAGDAGNE